jgi:hypothetical protein
MATTSALTTRRRADPIAAPQRRLDSRSPISLAATLASLVVAGFAAVVVYGRAAGYVYSEDSDFATEFGHHLWYHALTFWQILGKYFTIAHGWYRPTGFYLIPYLLRIDYFQPSEQIVLDIGTLVFAAVMITLFFPRPRVLTAVAASLVVLLAPALYQVTYGVQADSFYVIFGLAFLWLADHLYYGQYSGWRRVGIWLAASLAFFLTITTKEAGCIVALLVIPFLLLRGPDQLTRRDIIQAIRFAAPFLLAVLAFAVMFKANVNANSPNYSTHFSLQRLLNFINLIFWTVGFHSPRHTFENWVPQWTTGQTAVQAVILLLVIAGLAVTWRRFRLWRIAMALGSVVATAMAIAVVGGIPYHGYPVVIMYALIFLTVLEAAADWLDGLPERIRSFVVPAAGVVLVAVIFAMIYEAHGTYARVIATGPQSPFLSASTQLFDGSTLAPVRQSNDPLLVFQDCLEGLDDPLKFYARSATGTQLIFRPTFSYAAALPAMTQAYDAHRPVFAALCTGTDDPWYVLKRFEGPRLGLVAVGS